MVIALLLLVIGFYGVTKELGSGEPAHFTKIIAYAALGMAGLLGITLVQTNGRRRRRRNKDDKR